MAIDILFEKVKTFVAEEGAKSGQEIMDHLNVAAPVARSILRDMVLHREIVHRKGLYYLQGQEQPKKEPGIKGKRADVVEVDGANLVKVERTVRQRANDARKAAFEERKKLFEEHTTKPKEE